MGYASQLSPPPAAVNATELQCGNKILRLPGQALSVSAAFSVQLLGLQRIRSVTVLCLATLVRSAISQRLVWKDSLARLEADAQAANLWRQVLVDELPWTAIWRQPALARFMAREAVGDQSASPCREIVKLAPVAAVLAKAHVAARGPSGLIAESASNAF